MGAQVQPWSSTLLRALRHLSGATLSDAEASEIAMLSKAGRELQARVSRNWGPIEPSMGSYTEYKKLDLGSKGSGGPFVPISLKKLKVISSAIISSSIFH